MISLSEELPKCFPRRLCHATLQHRPPPRRRLPGRAAPAHSRDLCFLPLGRAAFGAAHSGGEAGDTGSTWHAASQVRGGVAWSPELPRDSSKCPLPDNKYETRRETGKGNSNAGKTLNRSREY